MFAMDWVTKCVLGMLAYICFGVTCILIILIRQERRAELLDFSVATAAQNEAKALDVDNEGMSKKAPIEFNKY
jgi:hypothetical protein